MRIILFIFVLFGGSYIAALCFCGAHDSMWSGIETVVVWLATSKLAIYITEGEGNN